MSTVNSWSQLEEVLKIKISQAMNTTVAEVVKKIESENVKDHVYKVYEPTSYKRRGDAGGLSDVRNMLHNTQINGNSIDLTVENNTMSHERYLPSNKSPHLIAEEVELGYGYDYVDMEARPFISNTVKELKDGLAKMIIVEGLKRQGLKVI